MLYYKYFSLFLYHTKYLHSLLLQIFFTATKTKSKMFKFSFNLKEKYLRLV
jgi:hypothetical protein